MFYEFFVSAYLAGYDLTCQPVDTSTNPLAMRVRIFYNDYSSWLILNLGYDVFFRWLAFAGGSFSLKLLISSTRYFENIKGFYF